MSKADKALAKVMDPAKTRNVRFDEATLALVRAGFVWDLGSGSHQVYRHNDGRRICLPCHGTEIKPAYVKQIRELLT
ncbi:MAG: type II toxin-antitoxin system HicA family toxin [Verrucomicrobiae bacterium]